MNRTINIKDNEYEENGVCVDDELVDEELMSEEDIAIMEYEKDLKMRAEEYASIVRELNGGRD